MDDWEMRDDVQKAISERWETIRREEITDLNDSDLADIAGMRAEFLRHHGFGMPGVDYAHDADPQTIGHRAGD
jgi:enoyl-[acyl-carrier protein] reductase/trans-2-enoyl-CoA reductase (NAD+)